MKAFILMVIAYRDFKIKKNRLYLKQSIFLPRNYITVREQQKATCISLFIVKDSLQLL